MARASGNREKIVEAAWELFWSRGYHATSIADIANRARLPKGSIYNYFTSKEELLLFVLGRLKYQIETELRLKVLSGSMSPAALVRRLLDHYLDLFAQHGYSRGDLLGSRLSELADTHPHLMEQLGQMQLSWRTVVAQKIWAYGTTAQLPEVVERAEELAGIIWAALQGVLLQMKISRSAQPLEEAKSTLVPMVASYVTALAAGDVPVG